MSPSDPARHSLLDHLVPARQQIADWIERIVERGIRRPGYDADRWTEEWSANQLRSFGLQDITLEPVELPMWEPLGAASLRAWPQSDPDRQIRLNGLALPHSRPVPQGIEAPLARSAPDDDGPSLEGKIAVQELELIRAPVAALRERATFSFDPENDFDRAVQVLPFGTSFMEVMEPAMQAGAVGFVGALTGVPWETSDYYVPYDALERAIPGMWLSPSSSHRLIAMLEQGPVRANLTADARRQATTTHNVVGSLPGISDDWVIIASHHDGPWASAVEDASGTALVLAQACYWSAVPEHQRPHNLLFLLTSGHMAGGAGTAAFVEQHPDLLRRTVLELHLEHAARECVPTEGRLVPTDRPEPRWWFTTCHPGLEALVESAIRAEDLRRSLVLPPDVFFESPPTDGSAFHGAGVPIVQFLSAPMYLFDAADTMDKVHLDTLVPLTRAAAGIVAGTEGAVAGTFRSAPTIG